MLVSSFTSTRALFYFTIHKTSKFIHVLRPSSHFNNGGDGDHGDHGVHDGRGVRDGHEHGHVRNQLAGRQAVR